MPFHLWHSLKLYRCILCNLIQQTCDIGHVLYLDTVSELELTNHNAHNVLDIKVKINNSINHTLSTG